MSFGWEQEENWEKNFLIIENGKVVSFGFYELFTQIQR
jgi:hypothetical protein